MHRSSLDLSSSRCSRKDMVPSESVPLAGIGSGREPDRVARGALAGPRRLGAHLLGDGTDRESRPGSLAPRGRRNGVLQIGLQLPELLELDLALEAGMEIVGGPLELGQGLPDRLA